MGNGPTIENHYSNTVVIETDPRVVPLLRQILRTVQGIDSEGDIVALNTEALLARVADIDTVGDSVLAVLQEVRDQLGDETAAQAAIDGAVAALTAQGAEFEAAITANTPAEPTPTEPTPDVPPVDVPTEPVPEVPAPDVVVPEEPTPGAPPVDETSGDEVQPDAPVNDGPVTDPDTGISQ